MPDQTPVYQSMNVEEALRAVSDLSGWRQAELDDWVRKCWVSLSNHLPDVTPSTLLPQRSMIWLLVLVGMFDEFYKVAFADDESLLTMEVTAEEFALDGIKDLVALFPDGKSIDSAIYDDDGTDRDDLAYDPSALKQRLVRALVLQENEPVFELLDALYGTHALYSWLYLSRSGVPSDLTADEFEEQAMEATGLTSLSGDEPAEKTGGWQWIEDGMTITFSRDE